MQADPAEEWRRLAEEYRDMGDEELRNLAADFSNLTETAQQALRQEMQSRGLGDPETVAAQAQGAGPSAGNAPWPVARSTDAMTDAVFALPNSIPGVVGRSPAIVPDDLKETSDGSGEGNDAANGSQEYTWKTVLCDCDTTEQAQELADALRRAGLDSWIQGSHEFGRRYARVLVAADQLEPARAIAAKPIPQEIVDDSKVEVPEFVLPKCPKCGAEDPVLESVESQNTWHCEQCDYVWSDSDELAGANPAKAADAAS